MLDLDPTPAHHSHIHMTKRGDEIAFVWSCCGERHTFSSRNARDRTLREHNEAYEAKQEKK